MILDEMLKENDGLLLRSEAMDAGVPNATFHSFVRKKQLQKVAHGIYLSPGADPDEMLLLQLTHPRAIYSHGTALYLHDLSEREPVPFTVTVPSNYNVGSLSDTGTRIHYVKPSWHELGACTMESYEGNPIRVYDMERTICDTIRRRATMEPSSFNHVMRGYARSRNKNLSRLARYAEVMNIELQVRDVLEVLL